MIEKADYFSTARFLGRGKYERHQFPSLEEARAHAKLKGDGRTMIYVVVGINAIWLENK